MAACSLIIEEHSCLEIFPNEIWIAILRNVKTVADYYKICSASSHLRSLLLKFRASEMLFPDVFCILLKHMAQTGADNEFKDLTKLRKVCSSWRSGVNGFFQNLHNFECMPFIHQDVDDLPDFVVERFTKAEDYALFEQRFDPTHLSGRNPFMTRRVMFTFRDPVDLEPAIEELFGACIQLLSKYGHHIWYCGIHQDMADILSRRMFYNLLPEMLNKMRNLQALEVYELFVDLMVLENNIMVPSTFPQLAKLGYMYLHGAPHSVVQQILSKNLQIQKVEVRGSQTVESMQAYMQLPKLQALTMELRDEDQTFEIFSRVGFSSKKIEKLNLNMMSIDDSVPWDTIFGAIQTQFSECKKLHLGLGYPKLEEFPFHFQQGLVLQNLKILFLELKVPVPIDFMLPMANNLTVFTLYSWKGEETEIFEVVAKRELFLKVYRFWRRLEKSNVWEYFSKLKKMTVGTLAGGHYSCTREKWRVDVEKRKLHWIG